MLLLLGGGAVAHADPVQPSPPEPVRVKVVMQSLPDPQLQSVAWSPDDTLVIGGFLDGLVVWDAAAGNLINRIAMPQPGNRLAIDKIGQLTVAADGKSATLMVAASRLDPASTYGAGPGDTPWVLMRARFDLIAGTATIAMVPQAEQSQLYQVIPITDQDIQQQRTTGSHRGHMQIEVTEQSIIIRRGPQARVQVTKLASQRRENLLGAALSPDGAQLALLYGDRDAYGEVTGKQSVGVFDLANNRFSAQFGPADWAVNHMAWTGNGHLLLTHAFERNIQMQATAVDLTLTDGKVQNFAAPPDAPVPVCTVTALHDGTLVGTPGPMCLQWAHQPGWDGDVVLVRHPGQPWQAMPVPMLDGRLITGITTAPDGARVAIVADRGVHDRNAPVDLVVLVLDVATGRLVAQASFPAAKCGLSVAFVGDGDHLVLAADDARLAWDLTQPGGSALTTLVAPDILPVSSDVDMIAADAQQVYDVLPDGLTIARFARAGGKRIQPDLAVHSTVALGAATDRPMVWTVSADDGVALWDTRSGKLLVTLYFFPRDKPTAIDNGLRFLAVTPEGRYDTNLPPNSNQFTWLASDEPLTALPSQTFMQDYFTPGLVPKLLECALADADHPCVEPLPALPPIASINRALPQRAKVLVSQGARPDLAHVDVTIRQGTLHERQSGVFGVHVLLDGLMVATDPADPPATPEGDKTAWQNANRPKLQADGSYHRAFDIPIPTIPNDKHVFNAYAFNTDRVKSDSAGEWLPAPRHLAARKPRLFVVSVGINDYGYWKLQLQFANADAAMMAKRFGAIRTVETHPIVLTTDPDHLMSRDRIGAVFDILAGRGTAASRALLAGVSGADKLDALTPDDSLVVTWSGHGDDADGRFTLLTSAFDAITADDLTHWLSPLNVREMALVIDACHAAGGVQKPGFKPGPMGDHGLGQLAYDKGLRILAATQSDSVAQEYAGLKQGLLTYVLTQMGLPEQGGPAEFLDDGKITLQAWLQYAVSTVPTISLDPEVQVKARGIGGGVMPLQPQIPQLFDFNRNRNTLVLRTLKP